MNYEQKELNRIDSMTGATFETYMTKLLRKDGYRNVVHTPQSNDHGLDAYGYNQNGIKVGFQFKCYDHNVPYEAVYETIGGARFYHTKINIIITNNYYAQRTKQTCKEMNRSDPKEPILLWDRMKLYNLISKSITKNNYEVPNKNNKNINKPVSFSKFMKESAKAHHDYDITIYYNKNDFKCYQYSHKNSKQTIINTTFDMKHHGIKFRGKALYFVGKYICTNPKITKIMNLDNYSEIISNHPISMNTNEYRHYYSKYDHCNYFIYFLSYYFQGKRLGRYIHHDKGDNYGGIKYLLNNKKVSNKKFDKGYLKGYSITNLNNNYLIAKAISALKIANTYQSSSNKVFRLGIHDALETIFYGLSHKRYSHNKNYKSGYNYFRNLEIKSFKD